MPISDIEAYFRSYDRKSSDVYSQNGAEPSAKDVSAFEKEIGFPLPQEFRDYAVHPLGGVYMGVKEEIWPEPEPYSVGPFWSFLRGVLVYSLSSEAPDWLSMRDAWRIFSEDGHPELVPFLKVLGDADPYCFTTDGGIVIWRHETPDTPQAVDMSFSQVLIHELRELEQRTRWKIEGKDKS